MAAGIDPATLSRILNRERDPRPNEATALASALEAEVGELFPDLRDLVETRK